MVAGSHEHAIRRKTRRACTRAGEVDPRTARFRGAQVSQARAQCLVWGMFASWAPTSHAQRALAPERGETWIALHPPEFSPFSCFTKTRYLAYPGGEKRRGLRGVVLQVSRRRRRTNRPRHLRPSSCCRFSWRRPSPDGATPWRPGTRRTAPARRPAGGERSPPRPAARAAV